MKPACHMFLLAGLGNTGSHLAPLLARMDLAGTLILADPDHVEASNMAAQAYGPDDIGKLKVEAVAERVVALNAHLQIVCHEGELEDLPLGCFRDKVILCVDHDGARQVAAERTWMMGGSLIDIAVNGVESLVRVTRIDGAPGRGCLECAWSDAQYTNLPVRHSCRKPAPTRAPASLGSYAASLAAFRILPPASSDSNMEIVSSPGAGGMWITRLPENRNCRFNHHIPEIEELDAFDFTRPIGELFDRFHADEIELPGFRFATRARCTGCGMEQDILRLERRADLLCGGCDWAMEIMPFHSRQEIRRSDMESRHAAVSLTDSGFVPGDVLRTDTGHWFQFGSPECITPSPASIRS